MSFRRRMFIPIVATILAGVIGGAVTLVSPAAAAVNPPCWGATCQGLDPQQTGCAAQQTGTLEEFTWAGVRIELRLSGYCHAAWGRATYNGPCNNNVAGDVWIRAYRDWQGQQWVASDYEQLPCNSNTVSWTSMMSFDYWVQAGYVTFSVSWFTGLH